MKNILIIDDHPIILEAYIRTLRDISNEGLNISTASDCDSGFERVFANLNDKKYELVIVDLNIPPSKEGQILSGEDLALEIKKKIPDVKIIIITAVQDKFRIKNILSNINPDGFLIKGDSGSKQIGKAYHAVLNNKTFYSSYVLELLQGEFTQDYHLDIIDKKILYFLSRGYRTNQLPELLPLSLRAIENRKRKLKTIFKVEPRGDSELLAKARKQGII